MEGSHSLVADGSDMLSACPLRPYTYLLRRLAAPSAQYAHRPERTIMCTRIAAV